MTADILVGYWSYPLCSILATPGDGGVRIDVVGPPPGELFSETNDNSVALLLTYGTARVLLAGDAEAREEEYMAFGPYTGPLTVVKVRNHKTTRAFLPRPASRGWHPADTSARV